MHSRLAMCDCNDWRYLCSKAIPPRKLSCHPRPLARTRKSDYFRLMDKTRIAKFQIGQVVRHRLYPFRGVIFDIDPEFNNTEEWYQSLPPEARPRKDQPFYQLFAEYAESEYIAYVSEQNLLPDASGDPVRHPQVAEVFEQDERGSYRPRNLLLN